MVVVRIAIAGDLHGQWDGADGELLAQLSPDAFLVVGDLHDGQQRIAASLGRLSLPTAVILGNHDTGHDASGHTLQRQLDHLGERHCGWKLRLLDPPGLAVVGARPCSLGGGYNLKPPVQAVWGPVSREESSGRMVRAALGAPLEVPLVLLAHCGPSGLGSLPGDPCGRDWKRPARDWGDQDLAEAIVAIRRHRSVPLVVFGHMHHQLRRGQGERISFLRDRHGTAYLNAASVPRHGTDDQGRRVRHFSWAELDGDGLLNASHRWYGLDGRLLYEQRLYQRLPAPLASEPTAVPC